ncbi:hypothetical protein JG687_00010193 [Phytophthora cactorum]|uniref:Retrovirus-related Pol polyprotein from transposon TNT 1-94-like beta-barrel domain-containing protein n=1 Tax=Phytophthora cactorum TaxID=29920 RepID=A0A8T1U7G6_9STRA|nr:hypothetical protein JG687_00010193 [Phytophthora cactorum]
MVDSGASNHLTSHSEGFKIVDDKVTLAVRVADGRTVVARVKGRQRIKALVQSRSGNEVEKGFVVNNVYLVFELPHTLLSVSALWCEGHRVSFCSRSCTISTASGGQAGCIARLDGGVYTVVSARQSNPHQHTTRTLSATALGKTLEMWHHRLGRGRPVGRSSLTTT